MESLSSEGLEVLAEVTSESDWLEESENEAVYSKAFSATLLNCLFS